MKICGMKRGRHDDTYNFVRGANPTTHTVSVAEMVWGLRMERMRVYRGGVERIRKGLLPPNWFQVLSIRRTPKTEY